MSLKDRKLYWEALPSIRQAMTSRIGHQPRSAFGHPSFAQLAKVFGVTPKISVRKEVGTQVFPSIIFVLMLLPKIPPQCNKFLIHFFTSKRFYLHLMHPQNSNSLVCYLVTLFFCTCSGEISALLNDPHSRWGQEVPKSGRQAHSRSACRQSHSVLHPAQTRCNCGRCGYRPPPWCRCPYSYRAQACPHRCRCG